MKYLFKVKYAWEFPKLNSLNRYRELEVNVLGTSVENIINSVKSYAEKRICGNYTELKIIEVTQLGQIDIE